MHSWPGLGLGVAADTLPADDMPAAGEATDKPADSSACLAHHASVPVAALESMAVSLVLGTGRLQCGGAGSEGAEIPH